MKLPAFVLAATLVSAPAPASASSILSGAFTVNMDVIFPVRGGFSFTLDSGDVVSGGYRDAGGFVMASFACWFPAGCHMPVSGQTGGFFFDRGDWAITAPTVAIDQGPGTYTGPASITGWYCRTGFFYDHPNPGPCLETIPLITGAGIVSLDVVVHPLPEPQPWGTGWYDVTRATYTFVGGAGSDGQSVPVPEPSTLLLIGSGLAIGWHQRRRLSSGGPLQREVSR